jgi:hypothetical protein
VLRSPPFRLSPTAFELAKGQETDIHVDFIPTTTGQAHRSTQAQKERHRLRQGHIDVDPWKGRAEELMFLCVVC